MSDQPDIKYILAVKEDRTVAPSLGVYKKVLAQIKVCRENGLATELYEAMILPVWRRVIPFASSSVDWCSIPVEDSLKAIYIRFCNTDFQLIRFLRMVKRRRPDIKTIIEYASFPYRGEGGFLDIKVIRDIYYSRFIKKYVDRIVSYSQDMIYGVPVISLMNGIDLDRVKVKKPCDTSTIRICSVANFAFWHGIDRLIKGMINYYEKGGTRDIVLTLIGHSNDVLEELRKMAEHPMVKDRIVFTGQLDGEALDKQFDNNNLAVECLGLFRKGPNLISSSLKSREYLAKGLPIVYSGQIDVFMKNDFRYVCRVPDTDEAICFDQIIDFYDGIYSSEKTEDVIQSIRRFAEEKVSMRQTFLPVIEYINNEEKQ